uniref:DBF4-type domain-containing protein n=1 Tax=Macrostomum lignano TaxID=282301 RepID=A0A1I8HXN8_9PLAT
GCLVEQFTLDSLRGKRVFFLYGESQKRQKKLESAVVYYGGSVASFFSNEVDLIIADDSAVSIEAKQSFSEFSRGFTMQQRAVTQTSSSQCRIVKTFEDILTKARLLQIPVYTPAIFRDRIRDQVSQHELCQKTISSGRFAEEDRNLTPPAVVVTDAQHLLRPIFKDNIDVVDIFANPRANNNDEKNRQKPDGKEKRKGRCENCREAYDDFNQHITLSQKHQDFVSNKKNFTEIDQIISTLPTLDSALNEATQKATAPMTHHDTKKPDSKALPNIFQQNDGDRRQAASLGENRQSARKYVDTESKKEPEVEFRSRQIERTGASKRGRKSRSRSRSASRLDEGAQSHNATADAGATPASKKAASPGENRRSTRKYVDTESRK